MSACSRWREEVTDHALGLSASPALQAHLAGCASCSAALADWRASAQQLDAGVRQMLLSEPSPYLASRILAKVNSRPPLHILYARWKMVAAAFALIVIVTLFLYDFRVMRRKKETEKAFSAAADLAHWRSPTRGLLRSSSDVWLKTVPRLGESYFEPQGERTAPKPRRGKT